MNLIKAIVAAGLLAVCVRSVEAQSPIVYNAARGTLPEAQCFIREGNLTVPYSVAAGELHVGPTALVNGASYSRAFFSRGDFSVDLLNGFAMEASFRVISSGCSQTSSTMPWPRFGIQLSIVDDNGRLCAAHFCSSQIALVNNASLPVSLPMQPQNVVVKNYTIGVETIVARIECSSARYRLLINGVEELWVVPAIPVGSPRKLYFGDGTGATSAEFFVSYVRAEGTSSNCTPSSLVNVPSGCAGLGTLVFSGILQPQVPIAFSLTIPGSNLGGVPAILVGPYAMQVPYCSAGCRLGLDLDTAFILPTDTLSVAVPALPSLIGWPIAIQGVRIGVPGACSTPVPHSLTDITVITL